MTCLGRANWRRNAWIESDCPPSGKLAADLSFPEQARVELARALCTGPRVFLLDEVMAALNDAEMDALLDLIRTLRDESGISFIVVEHHMRAIMRLCNRIMVLSFGQKIAEARPPRLRRIRP